MTANIYELMRNLSDEDAVVFSALADNGWNIELESFKYILHHYDPNIIHGPYETDEELIESARKLYNMKYAKADAQAGSNKSEGAPAEEVTQGRVVERLLSSSPVEHYSDHEIDLKNNLIKFLEAEGVSYERNIDCGINTAELATEEAVYEFKCGLALENIASVVESLLSCYKVLIDDTDSLVLHNAAAIIVTCCAPDLEGVKELAQGLEVEVRTLEEITSPSSPEFVESLFAQLKEIADVSGLSKFIEDNQLQEVIGDRRFTPTQQTKLDAALDECGERVTPPLPGEDDESFLVPEILISKIHIDPTIQSREGGTREETVEEYKEAMLEGAEFPPVRLFWDGQIYWLSRGFHRVPAAVRAGREIISCEVMRGGRREALLDSIGSNSQHGLQRTRADKRRAVTFLLKDPEWSQWSDGVIAKRAGVSQTFVSTLHRALDQSRDESSTQNNLSSTKRMSADGRVRETANIGRKKDESDSEAPLFDQRLDKETEEDGGVEESEPTLVEQPEPKQEAVTSAEIAGVEMPEDLASEGWEIVVHPPDEYHPAPRYSGTGLGSLPGSESSTGYVHTPEEAIADVRKAVASRVGLSSHASSKEAAHAVPAPTQDPPNRYQSDVEGLKAALHSAGTLSRLQLEDLGFTSALINTAVASGDVAQPETGMFTLPAKKESPAPTSKPERPPLEEMLKGGMLAVSFVFIPGVKGSVQLTINRTNKPETARRVMIDSAHVRGFSEPVMTVIKEELAKKLSTPQPKTVASKKGAAAKKPAARANKVSAKKSPAKKGAKSSKGKAQARGRR